MRKKRGPLCKILQSQRRLRVQWTREIEVHEGCQMQKAKVFSVPKKLVNVDKICWRNMWIYLKKGTRCIQNVLFYGLS